MMRYDALCREDACASGALVTVLAILTRSPVKRTVSLAPNLRPQRFLSLDGHGLSKRRSQ